MTEPPDFAPYAKYASLFEMQETFEETRRCTRADAFARLAELGVDSILNFIARGRLPAELSVELEIPNLYVQEYIDTLDKKRLETAWRSFAEMNVLRGYLALIAVPQSPQEAQSQKALAERTAWMAERADSARWGPPRKAEAPPPSVNLVFNFPTPGKEPKTLDATPVLAALPSLPAAPSE